MTPPSGICSSSDMRLGSEHGFVLGDLFWLGVYVSGSGVCWDVRESIANAGMHDSFRIVQLSGKPGEKRKHCKVGVKELEAGGSSGVFVSIVSPGVIMKEGESNMEYHGGSRV